MTPCSGLVRKQKRRYRSEGTAGKSMSTMTVVQEVDLDAGIKACRFCGASMERTFIDLGMSPLCETYPSAADLNRGETYYPLHAYVCSQCFLVQLNEYKSQENIFSDY